jgi:cytochrome c-type biogenesis protein CcmE
MKRTHIIALIGLAILLGVTLTMVGNYSSYANFAQAAEKQGKEVHVAGNFVKEKDLNYNPMEDANRFSFFMLDRDGNECKVICYGDKPQHFELTEEIVVIGKMKGEEFHATKLLTKCPSKYQDQEIAVKDGEEY